MTPRGLSSPPGRHRPLWRRLLPVGLLVIAALFIMLDGSKAAAVGESGSDVKSETTNDEQPAFGDLTGPGSFIIDDLTVFPFVPPAQVSAEPTRVELEVTDQPEQRIIRLTNIGDRAAGPLVLTTKPALPNEVTAALDCPSSLDPGASCQLGVTVNPRPEGAEDADFGIELFVGEEDGDVALTEIGLSLGLRPAQTTTTTTTTTTTDGAEDRPTNNNAEDRSTTENAEDGPTPDGFVGLVVAGLVLAFLVFRWLSRRRARSGPIPQPPGPTEPRPEPKPRPKVRARADEGTQSIVTIDPDRRRPTSVVARLGTADGEVAVTTHDSPIETEHEEATT